MSESNLLALFVGQLALKAVADEVMFTMAPDLNPKMTIRLRVGPHCYSYTFRPDEITRRTTTENAAAAVYTLMKGRLDEHIAATGDSVIA